MTVKEIAEQDIRKEMEKPSKCFLGKSFIKFREFLNPVMDCLVEQQLERQNQLNSK